MTKQIFEFPTIENGTDWDKISIEGTTLNYDYFRGVQNGFSVEFGTFEQAKWVANHIYNSLKNSKETYVDMTK